MQIDDYYNQQDKRFLFSREQASDFAKQVANDFNPLHDIDAKRFCVPGDLLFSVLLAKEGLSQHMNFTFSGMVTDGVSLDIVSSANTGFSLRDAKDKEYLSFHCSGDKTNKTSLIAELTEKYVAFSGKTFPHILVPLLSEQNVMINPGRPMVIYQSMAIDLDRLDISNIDLSFKHSTLKIDGKRGNVILSFNFTSDGEIIGHGEKHMVIGGLKEFDQQAMDELVTNYNRMKERYLSAL
jgi:hypothetical protein